MGFDVQRWLKADKSAADHYEFLGRPRFDPRLDELLQDIRKASRELLPYQNHKDSAIAKRTIALQYELARVATIFTDSKKLKQYHGVLLQQLHTEFLAGQSAAGPVRDEAAVKGWLTQEKRVHPQCLDVVCRAVISNRMEDAVTELDRTLVGESVTIQQAARAEPADQPAGRPARRVFQMRADAAVLPAPTPPAASAQESPAPSPRPAQVEVTCRCGQRFAAAEQLFGQTVNCSHCGAPLSIPLPSAAAPPDDDLSGWSLAGFLGDLAQELPSLCELCPQCRWELPQGFDFCPRCGWYEGAASAEPNEPQNVLAPQPDATVDKATASPPPAEGYTDRLPDVTVVLSVLAGGLAGLAACLAWFGILLGQRLLTLGGVLLCGALLVGYVWLILQLLSHRQVVLVDVHRSWQARFPMNLVRGYWVATNAGQLSCYSGVHGSMLNRRCYWVAVSRCWGVHHIYAVVKEFSAIDVAAQALLRD